MDTEDPAHSPDKLPDEAFLISHPDHCCGSLICFRTHMLTTDIISEINQLNSIIFDADPLDADLDLNTLEENIPTFNKS